MKIKKKEFIECMSLDTNVIFEKYEVYGNKDTRYIFIKSPFKKPAKILSVSHLDTVQDLMHPKDIALSRRACVATGLDDRLGLYINLHWLWENLINADILLTDGEESAASTAEFFEGADEYNWIVEFDREGEDAVTYGMENKDWNKQLKKAGFKIARGSFSDLCSLKTEKCAVNVGTGHSLSHSVISYVDFLALERQLKKFLRFYNKNMKINYIADPNKRDYGIGFGYGYDEGYGFATNSRRKRIIIPKDFDNRFPPYPSSSETIDSKYEGETCELCGLWNELIFFARDGTALCSDCKNYYDDAEVIERSEQSNNDYAPIPELEDDANIIDEETFTPCNDSEIHCDCCKLKKAQWQYRKVKKEKGHTSIAYKNFCNFCKKAKEITNGLSGKKKQNMLPETTPHTTAGIEFEILQGPWEKTTKCFCCGSDNAIWKEKPSRVVRDGDGTMNYARYCDTCKNNIEIRNSF